MPELRALVVGMHFRPPAKDVINMLAAGTPVVLMREPENEYDENAVKVVLFDFCEGGAHHDLRKLILDSGQYGEELFTNPLHLGYIDSKKTGMAKLFSEAMVSEGMEAVEAKLEFSMDGKPQVMTELEPAERTEVHDNADNDDLEVEDDDEEDQD